MPERLVRLAEVLQRTGMSRSNWYARMAAGSAPRPIAVGGIRVWPESTIDAWIAETVQASRGDGVAHTAPAA